MSRDVNFPADARRELKRNCPTPTEEPVSSNKKQATPVSREVMIFGKSFRSVNDSFVESSVPQTTRESSSSLHLGGIERVNQDIDLNNGVFASVGHSSGSSAGFPYIKNNNSVISPGNTTSSNAQMNAIASGSSFYNANNNYAPLRDAFNIGSNSVISEGPSKGNSVHSSVSMDRPFNMDSSSPILGRSYKKSGGNVITMGATYNNGNGKFTTTGLSSGRANENLIPTGHSFSSGTENFMSTGFPIDKADSRVISLGSEHNKAKSSFLSKGLAHDNNESRNVPILGCPNQYSGIGNTSALVSGYKTPSQASGGPNPDTVPDINRGLDSNTEDVPESKKTQKRRKDTTDTFPANVKSLLSTGIFDGIYVKYTTWARKKDVFGIINGSGIICGCKDCKFTKTVSAFELEHHAGCETKHPNNHIYFKNGKTIYQVAQELKKTPKDRLFDAIQNIAGSAVNEKNFNTWKATFLAADPELQRIHGNDNILEQS